MLVRLYAGYAELKENICKLHMFLQIRVAHNIKRVHNK